jgi:hypothetical protein
MEADESKPGPFAIRDCALVVVATGYSASDLRGLRDALLHVGAASIYHHFWGRLLQPQFAEREFNNDFASWVFRSLNDKTLAERLSVIDPSDFTEIDDLRHELVDLIEARLDERDLSAWHHAADPLHFTQAQMVVFSAGQQVDTPEELARLVPEMQQGSIFYHFIDARRRTPGGRDDFSAWLTGRGAEYADAVARLAAIDPYFSSLATTQRALAEALGGLAGPQLSAEAAA